MSQTVGEAEQVGGDGRVDQIGARLVHVDAVPAVAEIGGDRLVGAPLVGTLDELRPGATRTTMRSSGADR